MIFSILALQAFPEIDEAQFKKLKSSKQTFVVIFFAPWCGHCQQFKPDYEAASKKLKNIVDLVAVDCDKEANKPLCGQMEVKGFPTVKMFNHKGSKSPLDFNSARNEASLLNWVGANHVKPFVQLTTSSESDVKDLDSFVIVFTQSKKPASLLYQLARKHQEYKFLVKTDFQESDIQAYQSTPFASLIQADKTNVIKCKAGACAAFDGKTGFEEISQWLK
ncbi:Protein_disulfide isomerase [Hexamita inflata]|uniref:Protein disulfide isomerase n=1 Tax=Hexamita inflata TaxID=28002 RepID=A0AA86Q2S0_9EUKA|nr:Protein disulfide isomerase [Hexamita inflata]